MTIQVDRKVVGQREPAPSISPTVSSQQNGHRSLHDQHIYRVDTLFPHIIKAANKKLFIEIHQEIRAAPKEKIEATLKYRALEWTASLPTFMILFLWRMLWWMIMRYPRLQKYYGGTVGGNSSRYVWQREWLGNPAAAHTLDITLGGISEKPFVIGGRLETREYLNMTISTDHDIIDGAPATRFASRLKDLIESGYGLIDQASVSNRSKSITDARWHVILYSTCSVVVEVVGQIVADYIVEVVHIVDIAERKEIAEDTQQEKKIGGIAVEQQDFVDLVLPAGGDS